MKKPKPIGENPPKPWTPPEFIDAEIKQLIAERDRLRADLEKVTAEREELIAFLKTRYQSHYYCDDSWYSCPKHPDGCANDMITECNCGAEKNNEEITTFINRIQEVKK